MSNPLLAKVNVILFLNKCDLLQVGTSAYCHHVAIPYILVVTQAKLDAGVRLSHHMYTYGDRPNDYDSVSKCTS